MVLLCNGNEISWVRSYLGTNQFGYEPVIGIKIEPGSCVGKPKAEGV